MTIDYKTLNIRKTEYFYWINKTKSKTFPLIDASTCEAAILWEEPVCNALWEDEQWNRCVHNCTRGENVDLTIGYQRYYFFPNKGSIAGSGSLKLCTVIYLPMARYSPLLTLVDICIFGNYLYLALILYVRNEACRRDLSGNVLRCTVFSSRDLRVLGQCPTCNMEIYWEKL